MAWVKWSQMPLPYESGGLNVCNGLETSFWNDKWTGDLILKEAFPRLHRLEAVKEASVADRIHSENSSITFTWNWTAEPKWRTLDELNHLTDALKQISFSPNNPPKWSWKHCSSGPFSIDSLMSELNKQSSQLSVCQPTDLNSLVPQKIAIFIWRAMQNKLTVRSELDKKGIDLHSTRCLVCDNDIETLHHSLISCDFAKDIWDKVSKWWKLDNIHITSLYDMASLE
ncbi:uncharacterized protein [Rutidosis leptorrhynchoides]|uniref:uncharacterized protein n=1 Tax=Rutidosis leptorrhynchoides TaxID=125765 RepID=UPI003A9A5C73